jgi:hypothetical protein
MNCLSSSGPSMCRVSTVPASTDVLYGQSDEATAAAQSVGSRAWPWAIPIAISRPRLRRDFAELRTNLSTYLGLHQRATSPDRLTHETPNAHQLAIGDRRSIQEDELFVWRCRTRAGATSAICLPSSGCPLGDGRSIGNPLIPLTMAAPAGRRLSHPAPGAPECPRSTLPGRTNICSPATWTAPVMLSTVIRRGSQPRLPDYILELLGQVRPRIDPYLYSRGFHGRFVGFSSG